jgi:hypothetical protein
MNQKFQSQNLSGTSTIDGFGVEALINAERERLLLAF